MSGRAGSYTRLATDPALQEDGQAGAAEAWTRANGYAVLPVSPPGRDRRTLGEKVALWKRVSTDMTRQEIRTQDKALEDWVRVNGHEVVRVFNLEASAFKGEHDACLRETVEDVRAGRYTLIGMAMSSRIERRGWKTLFRYLLELDALGARVEATDDPNFGQLDNDNPVGAFATIFKGKGDHDYSKAISDNVTRTFRWMDDLGAFRGNPPAGYEITGEEHAKKLVPALRRREVLRVRGPRGGPRGKVPVTLPSRDDVITAFRDAGNATSTTVLGRRLGMTPDGVANMLKNPMYSTGRYEVRRKDGITYIYRTDPLVTPAVQALAIAGLAARRTGDNVTSRAIRKEDFSGALWCGACGNGRMYRYSGNTGKPRKDGTLSPRTRRYLCAACRKSVAANAADKAVDELMASRGTPWITMTLVPGNDVAAQLDRTRLEYRELGMRGLDFEAEDAERARLRTLIRQLEKAGIIPDRMQEGVARDERGAVITEGRRWASLSMAERRAWLADGSFSVLMWAAPGRKGGVIAEYEHHAGTREEAARAEPATR